MTSQTRKLLEKAKAFCQSWKVHKAYPIFRRYYDRLPFFPEPEHAEYMGWFVRTLFELEKEEELQFYLRQLERLHAQQPSPMLAYPLGIVYSFSSAGELEKAKTLLESIVTNPLAEEYHAKSRMMLAKIFYDRDDLPGCRTQIASIPVTETNPLIEIWRAIIERCEGNPEACRYRLEKLLPALRPQQDWYAVFSARVILAESLADLGEGNLCRKVTLAVKKMVTSRSSKAARAQWKALCQHLKTRESEPGLVFYKRKKGSLAHA